MPPAKELQKASVGSTMMTRSQKRKTKAVRKAQREHQTASCAPAPPPQHTQHLTDSSLLADAFLASSSSSNLLATSAVAAEQQQRTRAPTSSPSCKRRSTASGCSSGSRAGSRRGTPCVLSPRASAELDRACERDGWLLLDDVQDLENGWVEV